MRRISLCLVLAAAAGLATYGSVARGDSGERYLHSFMNAPPLCPFEWGTPDANVPACQVRFFAPRLALASQTLLLRIGDFEASRADCAAYAAGVTTTFAIDDVPVSITTLPCRYVPQAVANVTDGCCPIAVPVWMTDFRYLIPAGALHEGVHTVTWTATYTADVSFSLGCDDPSGRC